MISTMISHVTIAESKTILLNHNTIFQKEIGVQHVYLNACQSSHFLFRFNIQRFEFTKEMDIAPDASTKIRGHSVQEMLQETQVGAFGFYIQIK